MSRTSKLLTKEVAELAEGTLAKLGRTGAIAIKLRAIVSAYKYDITSVAKAFGTTKATLISWIKHVGRGEEFIKLLAVQDGRGRKYPLSKSHQNIVRKWMEEDSQITIDRLKQRIVIELGIELSRSTVHRIMKKLDFSYITARPRHYKQDIAALPEAKKKSDKAN